MYVIVYDINQTEFASYKETEEEILFDYGGETVIENNILHVRVPIKQEETVLGTLAAGFCVERTNATARATLWITLITTIIVLVFSIALSVYGINRTIVAPIGDVVNVSNAADTMSSAKRAE